MTTGLKYKNDLITLLAKLIKFNADFLLASQNEQDLLHLRDQIEKSEPTGALDQALVHEKSIQLCLATQRNLSNSPQVLTKLENLELEARVLFDAAKVKAIESQNTSPVCYLGSKDIREGF